MKLLSKHDDDFNYSFMTKNILVLYSILMIEQYAYTYTVPAETIFFLIWEL